MFARRLLSFVVVIGAMAGCKSTTESGPQPAHVIVSPDLVTIPQKGSATLTASVTDKDDQLITGAVVTFSSSNTQILTVSNLGVISSVGPAGSGSIVVKSGKASTNVPVTVTQVSSGITVTPDPVSMPQKTTLQLQAQVVDAVGTPIPGAAITYQPANPALISVSAIGLIQSLGASGSTSVVISSASMNRTVSVAITQVPSDLVVAPSSVRVGRGGKAQLGATVVDAVGTPIPNSTVTWSSSDQTLVTVSSTGVVTSVGGLGTATITVRSGTFTRTISVEVADISRPSATSVSTTSFTGAWGLGISATGAVIAPGSDGSRTARVDARLGTVTQTTGSAGGIDVTFSTNGATAYVANQVYNRIDIIDVATNTVTGNFATVQPIAVQISRDNSTLYVGSSGIVGVYDLTTKAEKGRITVSGVVNAMSLHPSLDLIYVTGYNAGIVSEISTTTNTVTRTFQTGGVAQQNVVSPNGNTLYVAIEGGDLAIFDLSSGTQQPSISNGGGFGAALTPDGLQLWVISGSTLKMVDLATRGITTFALPGGGRRIVFSADGSVAVITQEGSGIMFVR